MSLFVVGHEGRGASGAFEVYAYCPSEICAPEVRPRQVSPGQVSTIKTCPRQVRVRQVRVRQGRVLQVRPLQVRPPLSLKFLSGWKEPMSGAGVVGPHPPSEASKTIEKPRIN